MKPSLIELQEALVVAVKLFETNPHARALPGFHSFPENSCERAAALLTVALARRYPKAAVILVKGTNPSNNEHHFWTEISGFALDPTAHQFSGQSFPIACLVPSPLEDRFLRDEEHVDPQVSTDLEENSNGQWSNTLSALCLALEK